MMARPGRSTASSNPAALATPAWRPRPNGTIFCAFEHTPNYFQDFDGVDVSIAAFNLAWLREG